MTLYISVYGGDEDIIMNLIESAIGEFVVNQRTTYSNDHGLITIDNLKIEEPSRLVDYIWKWLTPRYKREHDVRFHRGAKPNPNMLLVEHMLW